MAKYKTEPLKCWNRAKELRLNVYKDIARARDEGRMIVAGGTESAIALNAGLDVEFLGGEPYGASCAYAGVTNPDIPISFFEAAEAAKYPRDMCAYMRLCLGSLLKNQYLFGGPYPVPTFNLQTHVCDTHGKWYQIFSEIEGVPYEVVDYVPYEWETENESEESKRLKKVYVRDQMLEVIEWMEKVSGTKYDDEKFIEAVNNECECTSLWAKCCVVNQAVPAVMDEKLMYSLYVIAVLIRHKKEAVDFYRELLDELKDRAARGIAAVANERFRMLHDSQPPWHNLDIFRHLRKYGVAVIGAHYSYSLSGGWEYDPELDSYVPAKTPKEAGVTLTTREEACDWYAEWLLKNHTLLRSLRFSREGKFKRILDIVKNWKVDGVMIHLNRGCEGTAVGQVELRQYLANQGIPAFGYEGNMGDEREFDLARTIDTIDTFMETVGLKMLQE